LGIISQVNAKRKKLFRGWWVVAAASAINAIGVGFFFYGWSTFFKPLQREFGWSRAEISGVSALSRLEGGLEGPVVGPLIDKFGSKKVLLFAVALTGAGFIGLSRVSNLVTLYVLFGVLAFGYNAGFTFATTAAVAKWFIKRRSRAISFVTTGNGIGGAALIPLLAWLIVQYGWRWTAIITGVAIWVVVLPIVVLAIRDTPEEMGLLPDGEPGGQARESEQKDKPAEATVSTGAYGLDEVNFTWREALVTPTFWVLAAAMFFRSCILSSIVIHEIPYLTDVGIPEVQAASILGLMVLVSIPGRLAFGWMGDRVNKKVLLLATSLLQAVGILILINVRASTMSLLYLFLIVYGLGYGGGIPLPTALRADLFGRKSFATITGMITPITMVSGMAGPIFAGYVYDVSRSYSLAFYTFAIMVALSGLLFLFIRQPKPPARLAHITSPSS